MRNINHRPFQNHGFNGLEERPTNPSLHARNHQSMNNLDHKNARSTEHLPFGVVQELINTHNLRGIPEERPMNPSLHARSHQSMNNLDFKNARPKEHQPFGVVQELINTHNLSPEERPTNPSLHAKTSVEFGGQKRPASSTLN